jgi:hypothetical protein
MLIVDLCLRLRSEPDVKPMYTVESFMREGLDTEKIRSDVIRVTGMTPAFYDNRTHIVVHHKLDYDILKQINDFDDILEVTGTYMGSMASIGPSHEPSTHAHRKTTTATT